MQNFHKNLVIFTALVYNERVFAEQMGYVNDLFRQTKETLHKARLTALHAICLQIFRHIAQKSLAIRQYACGISMQSAEKSDYASYAQALFSVSLTENGKLFSSIYTFCKKVAFGGFFLCGFLQKSGFSAKVVKNSHFII